MMITPGPWKAGAMSVGTGEGEPICRMIGNRNFAEHKANACLIAAAPELLAILRSLLREDGHYIECPCPPGYDHKYMPHSNAVKLCTRIQAAVALAETDTSE